VIKSIGIYQDIPESGETLTMLKPPQPGQPAAKRCKEKGQRKKSRRLTTDR
jgi:hypothetical protein